MRITEAGDAPSAMRTPTSLCGTPPRADRLRLLPGLHLNYDDKFVDFDQQVYGGLQTTAPVLLALQARSLRRRPTRTWPASPRGGNGQTRRRAPTHAHFLGVGEVAAQDADVGVDDLGLEVVDLGVGTPSGSR